MEVSTACREAAIERMLEHTTPASSDVPVPSIESPRIYCAPIVEFSCRIP